jgi:hypothetical protein
MRHLERGPMPHRAVGTTILKISYGYEVQADKDPLIELAEKAMKQFADTLTPGTYSVDVIPIRSFSILQYTAEFSHKTSAVKYLPSWFPGASFQKTARLYRQTLWDLVDIPFNMVLEQIVSVSEALEYWYTVMFRHRAPHHTPLHQVNSRGVSSSVQKKIT